ncbi:hypothetical protein P167DRAFT_539799 [Morchella conica CCBAS932]|uniref:Uncharacterized protein n=1 Tax=Morchella conica CCBAS932 TaxID=1392247 RepID=A0A3N4KEP6_9PEZI|nr:hypothetical protein P167DRAFT_539799 [Morchella conica CCBAS932]
MCLTDRCLVAYAGTNSNVSEQLSRRRNACIRIKPRVWQGGSSRRPILDRYLQLL